MAVSKNRKTQEQAQTLTKMAWLLVPLSVVSMAAFGFVLFTQTSMPLILGVAAFGLVCNIGIVVLCHCAIVRLGAAGKHAAASTFIPLAVTCAPVMGPIMAVYFGVLPMFKGSLRAATISTREGGRQWTSSSYGTFDIGGLGRPAGIVFLLMLFPQPLLFFASPGGGRLLAKWGVQAPDAAWDGQRRVIVKEERTFTCEGKNVEGSLSAEKGTLNFKDCIVESSPHFSGTSTPNFDNTTLKQPLRVGDNVTLTMTKGSVPKLDAGGDATGTLVSCEIMGGLYVSGKAVLRLKDCRIDGQVLISNHAAVRFESCTLAGNAEARGKSSITVKDCTVKNIRTIRDSKATISGGTADTIHVSGDSTVVVDRLKMATIWPQSRNLTVVRDSEVSSIGKPNFPIHADFANCKLGPIKVTNDRSAIVVDGGSLDALEAVPTTNVVISNCQTGKIHVGRSSELKLTKCRVAALTVDGNAAATVNGCEIDGLVSAKRGRSGSCRIVLTKCKLLGNMQADGSSDVRLKECDFNGTLSTSWDCQVLFRDCKLGMGYSHRQARNSKSRVIIEPAP